MKSKLKTSWETYSRIIWDAKFNENNFMVGYQDRMAESGRREKPVVEWSSSDIPWNRVQYFRCGDVLVWDRQAQIDLMDSDDLPEEALNPVGENNAETYSVQNSPFYPKPILYHKDGDWQYYMEQFPKVELTSLNIITYNILSDEYKQGFIKPSLRMDAIVDLLRECKAEIIVLQEVSLIMMRRLMKEGWMKDKFVSDKPNLKHFDSHRTIIIANYPFELYAYDYSKRKQFLAASWKLNDKPFHLGAVHLSSNRADNAKKIREEQLTSLTDFLNHLEGDYMIAGDFNMREEEGASFFNTRQLEDLWTTFHPNDKGYTFDTTKNLLAEFFSLSKEPGRLDRMLLHSSTSDWKAEGIELMACDEMAKGIYPSDHFGLTARLAFQKKESTKVSLQHIQPVYQSAIVIIPPEDKWTTIQQLRKKYDSKVKRWMPHITLVYGFLPSEYFEDAALLIADAIKKHSSFSVSLDEYGFFTHRKRVTAWLRPIADGFKSLQASLQGLFPQCTDEIKQANGFNPHLSIGQFSTVEEARQKLPVWKALDFDVNEVALISRKDDEPFNVDCTIELSSGKVTFTDATRAADFEHRVLLEKILPAINTDMAEIRDFAKSCLEQACAEALGNPLELYSLGSEKLATNSRLSDMDVVALIPASMPKEDFLTQVQQNLLGISESSRLVLDARVPLLKLSIEGVELDLMCAQNPFFPASIRELDVKDWHRFDESSWQAVAGYFEAENLEALVKASPIDMDLFKALLRTIKAWAKRRGLKGNSFGYLGNYSWTVMAVDVCINAQRVMSLHDLLLAFFNRLVATNWRNPIALIEEAKGCKIQEQQDRLPIITTVKPHFNSARNITFSTLDTIQSEARKAILMMKKKIFSWNRLLSEIDWEKELEHRIVFSVETEDAYSMNEFQGAIEGNLVGLVITLERELRIFVRPLPQFFKTEKGIEFHLGIQLLNGVSRSDIELILQRFTWQVEEEYGIQLLIK